MEDVMMGQYWCYMCSRNVNPTREAENKCPFCETGFLEAPSDSTDSRLDRLLSLYAPIFLGLMEGLSLPAPLPAPRELANNSFLREEDQEREPEAALRSWRGNSVSVISFFHNDPYVRMASESHENDHRGVSIVVFDHSNEEVFLLRGSIDLNQTHNSGQNSGASSVGLPVGQGFNLMLQNLLDNDANRYGIPPTPKAAIEAMPSVTVEEQTKCSICLEEIEIGVEAKEMPCKHKYHTGCIFSWLELHNSCPLCRYVMPTNDLKTETPDIPISDGRDQVFEHNQVRPRSEIVRYGTRIGLPIFWPLRNFLASSMFRTGGSSTVTPSEGAIPGQTSHAQESLIEDTQS